MIKDAIINLKDRSGSSRVALKKYVKANNKITAEGAFFDSLFNRALKSGVDKGVFAQPKGTCLPSNLHWVTFLTLPQDRPVEPSSLHH
jgi:hypothetical protein